MKMNHTFFEKACSFYCGLSLSIAFISSKVFDAQTTAKIALIFAVANLVTKALLQLARYHYLLHANRK